MEIQALPLGHRAVIGGPKQNLELVSDGKVDYFDESYYGQKDDQVQLRMDQGIRELADPRLVKSLSRLAGEFSRSGQIRQKTANECARGMGDQWHAQVHHRSFDHQYTVDFQLGDPNRVSPQEISFESSENRVNVRTFIPCELLGAGSHGMYGHSDATGLIADTVEYLSST